MSLDWAEKVGRFVAMDLETYLIEAGVLAPRIVCGSTASRLDGDVEGSLLARPQALRTARDRKSVV